MTTEEEKDKRRLEIAGLLFGTGTPGYCTKYLGDNRDARKNKCNVGGDPPRLHRNWKGEYEVECYRNISDWALEASSGCPHWRPFD